MKWLTLHSFRFMLISSLRIRNTFWPKKVGNCIILTLIINDFFWKLHRPLSQTKNIRYWRKHALWLLLAGSWMCCVLCNQAMYTTVSLDFWVWNEGIQCNQQVLMHLGICYASCFFVVVVTAYIFKTVVWTSDRLTENIHYFGTRNVQTQFEYQPQTHREKLPAKLWRPRRVKPVRCGM